MNTSLKRLLLLLLALGAMLVATSGCQTTKGFGRDVEHVGDKIQGK